MSVDIPLPHPYQEENSILPRSKAQSRMSASKLQMHLLCSPNLLQIDCTQTTFSNRESNTKSNPHCIGELHIKQVIMKDAQGKHKIVHDSKRTNRKTL